MFDLGLENKPEFNSSERGRWPREQQPQRHGGMTVRSVLKKSSVSTSSSDDILLPLSDIISW